MYKKCYSKQLNENLHQIYLWDDKDGYSTFKWEDKMGFDGMYPYQKYLIEKYGYNNQPSENHQILFFDLECEMVSQFNEEGFKESKLESIVYYHQNTDEWVCLIVGDKNKIQSEIDGKKVIVFEDEFSLLKHFLIKMIEIEVDMLIGWNSDSFDIPYLYVRSKLLFGSEFVKLLSPIGIVKESFDFNPQNPIQIYGVESIDFMRIHKSVYVKEETSYKLDYIGEKYCGLKKIGYDGNLNHLYESDINKFIKYNFRDVEILVELNKTLDYIPLILNISHRVK